MTRGTWLSRVVAIILALTSGSAFVGVAAAAGTPPTARSGLSAVLTLSTHSSTIGQRVIATVGQSDVPSHDALKRLTVSWGDGGKAIALPSLTARPSHRYVSPGRYTVRLTVTDRSDRTEHATTTVTVRSPAGSFAGGTSQNRSLAFFVSSDGRTLQDITVPIISLTCTPGGATTYDQLAIPATPIKAGGTFTVTTRQDGVFAGDPAVYSYRFSGRLSGLSSAGVVEARGAFRETLTYTDSAKRTCTSNNQTWTATRDAQPAQTTKAPPAGSYAGPTSQNRSLSLYVANDRKSLQDITIPIVGLDCAPGNATPYDQVTIPSIPITAVRSFSSSTSQTGVFAGEPARFTYVFRGNFHSVNADGASRATGTFRETVTYTDTAKRTCTSNLQSWSVSRDTQPSQTTAAAPAGSYTGPTSQGRSLTFYVANDRKSLQDIAIPIVGLACAPGGAQPYDELSIESAPISASRAFSATTSQVGVFNGEMATFAYAFRGNFHSVNADGTPRAAGTFRETVTYTDTAARACTSDIQAWTATRDAQPTQTGGRPPAGDYTGPTSQGRTVDFSVDPGGAALANISIPTVDLACIPAGDSMSDQLSITSATVKADGSFTATATQQGEFANQTATFTYSFRGNFHSVNADGTPRAAGTFRETVTYTDTAARTCMSDNQTWSATLTAPAG